MPEATCVDFTRFKEVRELTSGDAVGGDTDDFVVLPYVDRKTLLFVLEHHTAYGSLHREASFLQNTVNGRWPNFHV